MDVAVDGLCPGVNQVVVVSKDLSVDRPLSGLILVEVAGFLAVGANQLHDLASTGLEKGLGGALLWFKVLFIFKTREQHALQYFSV